MRQVFYLFFLLFISIYTQAQKKPLDHTVYDSWQSIGERAVSNDGKWVVYSITPQEGDNELVVQSTDGSYKKTIARGSNAVISQDNRFVVMRIRPFYKDTRDARIRKKRPDDMPKDSIAILELGKDDVWKYARVKNFKMPQKGSGWVAYHKEKSTEPASRPSRPTAGNDKKIADSLNRVIDSLKNVIAQQALSGKKKKNKDDEESAEFLLEELMTDADGDETPASPVDPGTDLVVRNLYDGKEKVFANVLEYYFNKQGDKLVLEHAKNPKDSTALNGVKVYDLSTGNEKQVANGGNDFRNFTFDENGVNLVFTAERDARPKELQKFYKIWHYRPGMDSAQLLIDKNTVGMKIGMTVSEHGTLSFSKTGSRLMFGTAPIQPPKDTTLVDIDLVKVDVWHYNDDYLQTQQLFRLNRDLQENFLAVYHFDNKTVKQLGSKEMPTVYATNEGDGARFAGVTDFGRRVESQWAGTTKKDIYSIDPVTGEQKLIRKDMLGVIFPTFLSPTGKYFTWYEYKTKNYYSWDGDSVRNITARIKTPLYNEDHDSPSDPAPYSIMRWSENDEDVFIYDKFGVWKVDPRGKKAPVHIIDRRKDKVTLRYVPLDPEERFLKSGQNMVFRSFNEKNKKYGLWEAVYSAAMATSSLKPIDPEGAFTTGQIAADKSGNTLVYTKESYTNSPDIYITSATIQGGPAADEVSKFWKSVKLSSINPQQAQYNWGTAELYTWKAFNGKTSEGILYKPENFDPKKKYPMIMYFYEKLSNTLYDYIEPTPTGSRLNISFFVSRGYLVFAPDITYTIGKPAKSAYDYIVSAAKDLSKHPWVDAKNIGIQGQSWGGIQVAQLVTMTDMFKAAWAGAPVANMTSAYGGIRWESGANRQFQYEKTQSRIGATLWEKPQLYIENSPLFHLPKVKTPLVIMANDADGAVPWYQGIELFTAMRRLGKKVWMLNYNGEAHNLVERKNKKDIQIREQQYFDWLLKGEKPAKWITLGVPAVNKGKDWGLEVE